MDDWNGWPLDEKDWIVPQWVDFKPCKPYCKDGVLKFDGGIKDIILSEWAIKYYHIVKGFVL